MPLHLNKLWAVRLLFRKQANAHWSKTICQSSFLSNPFCCVHDEPTKKCRNRYVHAVNKEPLQQLEMCDNENIHTKELWNDAFPFHRIHPIRCRLFFSAFFPFWFSFSPWLSLSLSLILSLFLFLPMLPGCLSIFLALCDSRGKLKQVH